MKVEEILAQKEMLFGSEVIIEGFLVEKAPEYGLFYLAPSDGMRDEKTKSIRIILPISRRDLENHISPWVGGAYGYADPATLTGILVPSEDGLFPAAITSLAKFSVGPSEEIVDVPLVS